MRSSSRATTHNTRSDEVLAPPVPVGESDDDTEDSIQENDRMELKATIQPTQVSLNNDKGKKQKYLPAFIRREFGAVLIHKVLYSNLYVFMLSDFYLRSMSLIIFVSSIPCSRSESAPVCGVRVAVGMILFLGLLIFEFMMNKRMRIKEYQSYGFILTIFPVSILSSFYTILSTLDLLKNDTFFGKCVDFKSFLFEHKVRIYLSIAMNLLNVILFAVNDEDRNAFIAVLIVIYFVVLPLNYFSLNKIQKYVDPPNQYPFILFSFKEGGKRKECDCMGQVINLCSKHSKTGYTPTANIPNSNE